MSPVTRHPSPRSGVALVVTLIMLAVITFMTVTFLSLSTREKGAVTTSTEQTIARLAAEAALERAKAELLAGILSTTNSANYGLLVSTNFVRRDGFDPGSVYDQRTNVNYDYRQGGGLLNAAERLQNLANLLYDPRVPVVVTNRAFINSNEFRYYLDLNRNGRHDRSGLWPALNPNGGFYLADGSETATIPPAGVVSNVFTGDPEWIGGLERPDLPHSSTNKFLYRYAFFAVPSGKTLDVNYIHNQAAAAVAPQLKMDAAGRDYYRNQGVGAWEINLAAFLYDLNTNNLYGWGGTYSFPVPPRNFPQPSDPNISGNAFADAAALYRYRLNGNPIADNYALPSFNSLYNVPPFAPGPFNAFINDCIDGYTDGPLLSTNNYWGLPKANEDTPSLPWVGADNPYHFFTTQDLFDRAKTAAGGGLTFPDRLGILGTNLSSYDQYTFYRLAEQLGTDSAPDGADKLNLNYKNTAGLSATNFVAWTPEDFFTNAADRLLKTCTAAWFRASPSNYLATYYGYYGYTNQDEVGLTNRPYFGMVNEVPAFGIANIPVSFAGGNDVYSANLNRSGGRIFVHTPAVHRLLQLAANIGDATTNRAGALGADFPSVFKPVFQRDPNNNVYIVGYNRVDTVPANTDARFNKPLDLSDASQAALVQPNDNIYGVPWIIAAKKGFPNFNEVGLKTVLEVTRKLQITRSAASALADKRPSEDPTARTNMLWVMGLSSELAVEAWNSYTTNYNRSVEILVATDFSIQLTNNYGYRLTLPPNFVTPVVTNIPANAWLGNKIANDGSSPSFKIPLQTNITLLPVQAYQFPSQAPPNGQFTTNWDAAWKILEPNQEVPQPQWGLLVTNRLRFIMLDASTRRVIDYVQLNNLTGVTNLSEVIRDPDSDPDGYQGLWKTNWLSGGLPNGFLNQINVAQGKYGTKTSDWIPATKVKYNKSVQDEIDLFAALFHFGLWQPLPNGLHNTNRVVQVPFTPTAKYYQYLSWQANDPLVHYMSGDLADLLGTGNGWTKTLPSSNGLSLYELGIGKVYGYGGRGRYQPWGFKDSADAGTAPSATDMKDKTRYDLTLKDPMIRSSDDWDFPTNKFPNLGWLGRVHRGTPWQTVFMKAEDLGVSAALNTNFAKLFTNTTYWVTNVNAASIAKKWAVWSGNSNATDFFFTRPATDRLIFDVFSTAFNDNAARGQLSINQSGLAAWSAVFGGVVALRNSSTDAELKAVPPLVKYDPVIIPPAGTFDLFNTNAWPAMMKLVAGINRERSNPTNHQSQTFEHLGDILSVPELTDRSPFLNNSGLALQKGLNDQVYEWLPQQVMSLLRLGDPRFVIYSYGQALRPADGSVFTSSGPFFGMVTNYQIAAEVAMRAVVRVDGSPDPAKTSTNLPPAKRYPPRIIVESFNLLPPD